MNFKTLLISVFLTTGLVVTFVNFIEKSNVCVKDSVISSIVTTSRSGSVVILENGGKAKLPWHTVKVGMTVCLVHDVHLNVFGNKSISETNVKSSYLIN